MKPIFFSKKEGVIINKDNIINSIMGRLNLCTNGNYTIKINKVSTERTCPQNRLYRLWLSYIANEKGNDVEDLHDFFKQKFLSAKMGNIFGEQYIKEITTTKLDTQEFADYLEKVNAFAANLGINLPNPEDLDFDEFYNEYYSDK